MADNTVAPSVARKKSMDKKIAATTPNCPMKITGSSGGGDAMSEKLSHE